MIWPQIATEIYIGCGVSTAALVAAGLTPAERRDWAVWLCLVAVGLFWWVVAAAAAASALLDGVDPYREGR